MDNQQARQLVTDIEQFIRDVIQAELAPSGSKIRLEREDVVAKKAERLAKKMFEVL